MAKVRLDIETDLSQVTTALSKGEQLIQESGVTVQQFGDEAKAAYTEAWKEANKYNKELAIANKQTDQLEKETKNIGKTKSYIQQLKQEIKFYTSEAAKAGEGTKEFAENLEKAGKLKDELADLNAAVNALNGNIGENLAKAGGESISLLASGYEGLIGLQNLLGEETGNYEKALLKLQSIQSIARVAKEFAGIKDTLTEIKLGFKPVLDLYTKGNEGLKKFFKNFKENRDDVEDTRGFFTKLTDGVKNFATSGITSVKSLWAVIRANPLGVILTVIGTVIGILVALKDKVKPIAALFDYLGKAVDAIIAPFIKLAEIVGLIADENERRARATIDATEKEVAAIKKRYDFEIALLEIAGKRTAKAEEEKYQATKKRLKDTQNLIESMLGSEQTKEDIETLKKTYEELEELERDRTLFLAKEQKARFDYDVDIYEEADRVRIAAIKDDEKREIETALAKRRIALKASHDKLSLLYDENEIFEHDQEVTKIIYENTELEISEIRKKYAEKRLEEEKKNLEKLKALEKDFQDALSDILKRVDAARTAKLTGNDRIEAETDAARKELEILRQGLITRGQNIENFLAEKEKRQAKHFELSADQQEQFNILEQALFEQETQKLISLEVERQNALAKAKADNARTAESTLQTQEEADIKAVEGMRPEDTGVRAEIDFEKQKQIAILNIQKDYADKRLELRKATLAAEREEAIKGYNGELAVIGEGEDAETKAKRAAVIERLELTEKQYAAQNELADNAYKAELKGIDDQLKQLNSKKPFDLAKLLGISDDQLANLEGAIQNLTSELQNLSDAYFDSRAQIIDGEISKNQELVAERETNIDKLKSQLEKEQELQENGKANNVARINDQIAFEEEKRQEALEAERKAKKERAELAKQQLIIDTIVQASNLVVAATQIYATVAKDPYTTAIATATVVAMLAAFAVQKAAAFKAVNNDLNAANKFKEGVIDLQGPGTPTSDSIPAWLSRGESVMTARETKDNLSLFKGIRYKNKALIEDGIMELLENTGVTLPKDLPKNLTEAKNKLKEHEINIVMNNDYESLRREQAATNKRLDELIANAKNSTYKDQNNNLVHKSGTHTTITRKNG